MNHELIAAAQAALAAQFEAGKAIGKLEYLLTKALPQVAQEPQKEPE